MTKPKPAKGREYIRQADARRYRETLEALDSLLTDEIQARFGHPHLSEERAAGKSRIYPLLSLPRNMARGALTPSRRRKG